MTNRNKAKGTAWESEIVGELQVQGHTSARRVVQAGAADVGDIHLGAILSPLVAIEAKNEKALTFSSYVDEAKKEGDNAGALYGGVAWVKRRGKASARDGYVVMDGQTFIDILHALDTQLARGGALPHHVVLPPVEDELAAQDRRALLAADVIDDFYRRELVREARASVALDGETQTFGAQA